MIQHFKQLNCINFFQLFFTFTHFMRHASIPCLILHILSGCWLSLKRNIFVQTISLHILVTAKQISLLLKIKRLMLLQVHYVFTFSLLHIVMVKKSNSTLWFYFERLKEYPVLCKEEKGISGCVCSTTKML